MKKKIRIKSSTQMSLGVTTEEKSALVQPDRFKDISRLKDKQIFIGTSGYSYDDWVGPFYPPGTRKPQMLEYYQRYFSCVELNFSYYTMPSARTLHQIRAKAPRMKFAVKAHQSITHERSGDREGWKQFAEALEPFRETGQLASLLFQFPYSFHFSQAALDYVMRLHEYFESLPIVMEFRHSGWFVEALFTALHRNRIGICSVDAPRLKGLTHNQVLATNRQGYYRLHGRNARNWFDGDNVTRYDYTYRKEEIEELAENVLALMSKTDEVYVYANNHPRGQAVQAAVELAEELQRRVGMDNE